MHLSERPGRGLARARIRVGQREEERLARAFVLRDAAEQLDQAMAGGGLGSGEGLHHRGDERRAERSQGALDELRVLVGDGPQEREQRAHVPSTGGEPLGMKLGGERVGHLDLFRFGVAA